MRLGWLICPWMGTAPKPRLRSCSAILHAARAPQPLQPCSRQRRAREQGHAPACAIAGAREDHDRRPRLLRQEVGQVRVLQRRICQCAAPARHGTSMAGLALVP